MEVTAQHHTAFQRSWHHSWLNVELVSYLVAFLSREKESGKIRRKEKSFVIIKFLIFKK